MPKRDRYDSPKNIRAKKKRYADKRMDPDSPYWIPDWFRFPEKR